MTTERRMISPRYAPADVEPAIYERWLASGAFTPAAEPPDGAERFVIIQPPPNVTGALHLGHALTATVEDVLIRYHRMRGDDTLWLPGVDHAGIAAQFVLDKIIAEEGETRESLGRERYLERMWRFINETRSVMGNQHRRLGASLDWTRERFTMDDGSARAVRVAFKRLWDAGLVYRGEAMVNWCPRCRTTISDLENIHREEVGTLWTIRYHLEQPDGSADPGHWISVATTRPETLLGDVAVAVHPDDDRYRELVGRLAILPFLGRRLPIIADESVDPKFGTGAVKITPAHDVDDYALSKRHGLLAITVLDEEARINEEGGEFAGLDRYEARRAIVERLREMGNLEGEAPHPMAVGHCEKCDTVVEPRLSVQWFVHVKPLADRALASVREGRTRIVPPHFEKVYTHWMENIHDWAVGRQLWWGHRIPAWYCPDGHITVTDVEAGPDACAECGRPASELTRETDIFDTWFSSGLWPFSTLGWPDETPDLQRFYPTSVMETAYEILFFWVARMMMLGLFCTDIEPFHTVYLHGIVRDPYGQKMSKTKGNVVDPLEMIREVGADALRFALVSGNAPGVDQRLTSARITGGRNFTTKLWNAARFVLGARPEPLAEPSGEPTLPERWIRSRLAEAVEQATRQLDQLDLAGYAATAYEFAWSDYCDWFLEMAKVDLRRPDATPGDRARVWLTTAEMLADLMRLLHPIVPFVTEEIWDVLHDDAPGVTRGEPLLVIAAWPLVRERDAIAEEAINGSIELIREYREQRNAQKVPAATWVPATAMTAYGVAHEALHASSSYVEALARVRPFSVVATDAATEVPSHASSTRLAPAAWIDASAVGRVATGLRDASSEALTIRIERLRELLSKPEFVERAPASVVARERARLAELEEQLHGLGGD
ncbi:MAG TPA: valine--tRNA ligase [Candidatus Saccharimonadales bacterium]|nr:valine--tRNA ligase [Candidatus Saccharimonadales bacterium]